MSCNSYVPLTDPQLNLCMNMEVVYYCEIAHLLKDRSEHTCASALYYQVDLVIKVSHCNAKYMINLKPEPILLGALIMLSFLPKWGILICAPENRLFLLEYSTYRVINRTEFCECSFFARPYYLTQTMLSCKNNAAAIGKLLSTCYVFDKILFDYLKAYHQIWPKWEMQQGLMPLTQDIPSYDLPGLNVKMPAKSLSKRIQDKESNPFHGEL